MIYTVSKNEQKLSVGTLKKIQDFRPRDIYPAILRLQDVRNYGR